MVIFDELSEEADNPDLLFICSAGGCQIKIWADGMPDFANFVSTFTEKIPWALLSPAIFKYELNNNPDCSLNSDADYKNLLLLCTYLRVDIVKVQLVPPAFVPVPVTPQKENMNQKPTTPDNIATKPAARAVAKKTFNYNGRLLQDIEGPSKKINKTKRKIVLPESLFDEPIYTPKTHAYTNPMKPSKRKEREERHARGDFFPGALSNTPRFVFNPEEEAPILRSANWVYYMKGVGQEFRGGMEEFRPKLIKYAAKLGFQFKYSKNDSVYCKAYCARKIVDGCKWHINGAVSFVTESLFVKQADLTHTCQLSMQINDDRRMGQRIFGYLITDAIRAYPHLTAIDLQREILKYWGFKVSYGKVWRSVEVARASIFGSYIDSFDELRWYSHAIEKTNPGSIVALETEPYDNRFKRFFLAFDASIKGFQKCRPILFVDGTFMKTKYKGTLLAATAKDGNNGLFPVAMAIVDSENTDNWTWFLKKIKSSVKHHEQIMYISDRAGGLMNAFDDVYEKKALHFFCLFHLMKNLRGMFSGRKHSDKFKNHLCKLLKDAAYTPNIRLFEVAINKFVAKGGATARHFLQDLPYTKWAVAFNPQVHRYGELTSNAAESFNSWIFDARSLPVTYMLDCIRAQLMRWFHERREASSKWTGALTPEIDTVWNEDFKIGENWQIANTCEHGIFEVISRPTCVVNLHAQTCTCYQWQVRGFPCVHAIACIDKARWDIRRVVKAYFFVTTYKGVYAANMYPIPTTEKHEFIDLNQPVRIEPPVMRRDPGRPKKLRHRTRGERKPGKFLCGRCGKYGTHYWTTCREALPDGEEEDDSFDPNSDSEDDGEEETDFTKFCKLDM